MTTKDISRNYLDGWNHALDQVEHSAQQAGCEHCAVATARFTGLTLASQLIGTDSEQPAVVARMIELAMNERVIEQSQLVPVARNLAEQSPTDAADALVILTLIAAKRYRGEPLNPIDETRNDVAQPHA